MPTTPLAQTRRKFAHVGGAISVRSARCSDGRHGGCSVFGVRVFFASSGELKKDQHLSGERNVVTLAEKFATTYASLHDETAAPELVPVGLARACVGVLPIAGAGISMFSGDDIRVPIGASGQVPDPARQSPKRQPIARPLQVRHE